jgi:hypothetical protein
METTSKYRDTDYLRMAIQTIEEMILEGVAYKSNFPDEQPIIMSENNTHGAFEYLLKYLENKQLISFGKFEHLTYFDEDGRILLDSHGGMITTEDVYCPYNLLNVEGLKRELEEFKRECTPRELNAWSSDGKPTIETITVQQLKSDFESTFYIAINGNFIDAIECNLHKKRDRLLYELAENGYIDIYPENKKDLDNFRAYFNCERKNKIYTQTGCMLTKILKQSSNQLRRNISIQLISEKSFKSKLLKAQKVNNSK